MDNNEMLRGFIRESARVDQQVAAIWDAVLEDTEVSVPVLIAMAGGEKHHCDCLSDESFRLLMKMAKLGMATVMLRKAEASIDRET